MIFENKIDNNSDLNLDSEFICSCNINKELLEGIDKNNEFFLTNGIYNFIKYNENKFISESINDYNILTQKLLDTIQDKIKKMYKDTIDILKAFNKDRKLIDIVIRLLTEKENSNIEIKGEIEDYEYSVPIDSSYMKSFNDFILAIKLEYLTDINPINPTLVDKLNIKYSTDYFNKFRGDLIKKPPIAYPDFPEEVFKYFRCDQLDIKYLNINSESIQQCIEKYKVIIDYINLLSDEYKNLEKFYSEIRLLISDQSKLRSNIKMDEVEDKSYVYKYDKVQYNDKEKLYIDYITLRRQHMSIMLSTYNTYFIEKLLAVKQMYKSYYNQCALYYTKIKY